MSDIVDRLKTSSALEGDPAIYRHFSSLLADAVAEIERLHAINVRYKRALDEIARHDLQFVAMSALRNA